MSSQNNMSALMKWEVQLNLKGFLPLEASTETPKNAVARIMCLHQVYLFSELVSLPMQYRTA